MQLVCPYSEYSLEYRWCPDLLINTSSRHDAIRDLRQVSHGRLIAANTILLQVAVLDYLVAPKLIIRILAIFLL
jgi:hypothetical protein